jgi:hypothetical protein
MAPIVGTVVTCDVGESSNYARKERGKPFGGRAEPHLRS